MISYGNNQYSTHLTVALLLILSSARRSFSSNLDPLRSYPSANEAILLDFFHERASDLLPLHLADTSLVRVSLGYAVDSYTLSPIQVCTHMRVYEQTPSRPPECLTLKEQILPKAPQITLISSSSEIFVTVITIPELNLETILKLQTAPL